MSKESKISCDTSKKGGLWMCIPSNASLKATILGCFILDSRTASLLEISNLDGFYKNANTNMDAFSIMQNKQPHVSVQATMWWVISTVQTAFPHQTAGHNSLNSNIVSATL